MRPKRKDFKLTEADIERELYEDFKLDKIELGSPEAYACMEKLYISTELDNRLWDTRLCNVHQYIKQRNILIFISVVLAALCLFFALRPSLAPSVPASTPAVTTTQAVTRTSGQYVASVNSNKFHRTSCRHAQDILNENRVYYDTVTEAEDDGKEPCSVCRP